MNTKYKVFGTVPEIHYLSFCPKMCIVTITRRIHTARISIGPGQTLTQGKTNSSAACIAVPPVVGCSSLVPHGSLLYNFPADRIWNSYLSFIKISFACIQTLNLGEFRYRYGTNGRKSQQRKSNQGSKAKVRETVIHQVNRVTDAGKD